jgi:hypothetical protein
MFSSRKVLSLACVLAASSVAWAQAPASRAASAPSAPVKTTPILDVVPAGSLGFVVVSNIGKTLGNVDQYLKDIGVADALPIAGDLLTTIKEAAQLGEGFNAEGGFAAVLLDPQPFGIDFVKMIKDEDAAGADAVKPKVPFVLFVPATGLKEVFGKYEMTPEAELTKVKFRAGDAYAAMLNGYAVVSPNDKAVQAVLKAQKKASGELAADLSKALLASDVALYVNMKTAAPQLKGLLDLMKAKMTEAPGPMPFSPDMIVGIWSKMLTELQAFSCTLQFGKTGLVFQEYVGFDPNGPIGQSMLALKPGGQAALDRLPNLPYVLAIGGLPGPKGPGEKEMVDLLLKALPGLTDATRAKITKLQQDMEDQITGLQLVIGGAPEGSGVFGASVVLSCKDGEKVKGLLGDATETIAAVVQGLAGDDKNAAQLKVVYAKGAEKIGELSIDAITITHPDIDQLTEEQKQSMQKVLGEDKIRLLVASADNKTVVITFGGSTAMLLEALKTSNGTGTIGKDPGVVEVMKVLPANPRSVMVLNVANLMQVVQKAAAALGAPMPPIQLTSKTPIAMGAAVDGATARAVFFLPNDLVKEVVSLVRGFLGGMMGPGAGPNAAPNAAPPGRRPAPPPMRGGESF